MLRIISAALLSLAAHGAFAQTVMDGTDLAVSAGDMKALRDAMAGRLNDPYGAQLRSLTSAAPGRVCGQVNAKNTLGGFVGFRRFGADMTKGRLYIEPVEDLERRSKAELQAMLADLEGVRDTCNR